MSGVGTVGLLGGVGAGLSAVQTSATQARASGLAVAAGAEGALRSVPAAGRAGRAPAIAGLALGYLPGSARVFDPNLMGARSTAGSRWAKWDPSLAALNFPLAVPSLVKSDSVVDISISMLQQAGTLNGSALKSLDVVAHFAITEAPFFAPFEAWHYRGASRSTPAKYSQPITFSGSVPDFVSLQVNYAINASAVAAGTSSSGLLYLPIGASANSRAGLSTGLYVFATPCAGTGAQPDFGTYVFSGNFRAPIAEPSGRPIDFDYLTLAIRPASV